jgi:hypothetical protein
MTRSRISLITVQHGIARPGLIQVAVWCRFQLLRRGAELRVILAAKSGSRLGDLIEGKPHQNSR